MFIFFAKIYCFSSRNKIGKQLSYFVFFAKVKIGDFLQLFYMLETSKMVGVKVVLIDVLYQYAKFGTTFLEHLVYRVTHLLTTKRQP